MVFFADMKYFTDYVFFLLLAPLHSFPFSFASFSITLFAQKPYSLIPWCYLNHMAIYIYRHTCHCLSPLIPPSPLGGTTSIPDGILILKGAGSFHIHRKTMKELRTLAVLGVQEQPNLAQNLVTHRH